MGRPFRVICSRGCKDTGCFPDIKEVSRHPRAYRRKRRYRNFVYYPELYLHGELRTERARRRPKSSAAVHGGSGGTGMLRSGVYGFLPCGR